MHWKTTLINWLYILFFISKNGAIVINNSSLESNSNAIFELYAVKYFFLFNKY